jgi:hypothetical protein
MALIENGCCCRSNYLANNFELSLTTLGLAISSFPATRHQAGICCLFITKSQNRMSKSVIDVENE